MSRIVLRVAQIIGVLVLAGLAIGIVVGLVQWLFGLVVIVALVAGGVWLFKKVTGREAKPVVGASAQALPAGSDRRTELESRAVLDASAAAAGAGRPSCTRTVRLPDHPAEVPRHRTVFADRRRRSSLVSNRCRCCSRIARPRGVSGWR